MFINCLLIELLLKLILSIYQFFRINTNNITAMCQHNADVAATLERPDLVQAWCLASLVLSQPILNTHSSQVTDSDIGWSIHPFGQNLLHSL